MAEFIINVASVIVTPIGKYVIKPIGNQLGYIVFYNRNKNEIKEQLESLETTKKDLDLRVEDAKSKAYTIFTKVSEWLVAADDEIKKSDELFNSNPPCLNFLQRHQLSRKARKRATDIRRLKDGGNNFLEVGCPAPLPDTMNTIVPEAYQTLGSKTSMAKQIKDALAKPEVRKVGIYGMGGVGKTYLLKEVKKLVLEEKLFDLVIDVTVGQSNDVMNMQQQIGDFLNKELPKSKEGRTSFLRNALVEMKGNILITFDDLWNEFDIINDVGIPLSKEGCKTLVTSRFQNVLANKMNIKECFKVTCLDDEESWKFFKKIIGDEFDAKMENIAKEVAKQCGGLPLALDIIAKTLKRSRHINYYWEGVLSKLKNSIPVNIDVGEKVYASLKLSYEHLDGEEVKSLFLLCSVFPDDHGISVNDLQMYVMGMGLLKMVNTWKEARAEAHYLVEDLTSSSLLQRLKNRDVKMHDIVRDVAIYIGPDFNMSTLYYGYSTSSKGLDEDKCRSYRAIFVDCKKFCNLLPNLKLPKLELLILSFPFWGKDRNIDIMDAYFEGMENLKVLDIEGTSFLQPFWTPLKNLRTLCMSYCWCEDIDTIGHLKQLEILRISNCRGITELPTSMSELKQLKVLVVSHCFKLVVIHTNIISSMTKLEELDIQDCFKEWGEEVRYKNTWIPNAQLSELNCLSHLSILRVRVLKLTILSEALSSQMLKNLREFFIYVGTHEPKFHPFKSWSSFDKYEKNMSFNMKSQIVSVNGTKLSILLEGTKRLMILNDSKGFANDIFKAIGNGYPLLKCLEIHDNSETPHLRGNDFTSLKRLVLDRMVMLESIIPRHSPINPFNKLKFIKIGRCEQLRNFFPLSVFKGLSNLRQIEIYECNMMEEIVSIEIEDHITIYTSPLTSLRIERVNKLTSFCSTKSSIQQTIVPLFDERRVSFPELKYLSIGRANNLEMLWHKNGSSFSKLQTIEISDCKELRCVFPSNIATSLVFLDTLKIYGCELLEMIFEIEKQKTSGDTKVVPLRYLSLGFLKNLKYVWDKDVDDVVAFPNLKKVKVGRCPKLKIIFPASFTKYMKEIEELEMVEPFNYEIFPVDEASKLKEVALFQSLETLRMSCKQAVKERFWVMSKFFKLKSLELFGCEDGKMISLPMEMNEVLYSIEELTIRGCLQLVDVIGNDYYIQRCANLKKLKLYNLPKLMYVLKNMNQMTATTFSKLVYLQVGGCNGMINLFSPSVAKNLANLNSIEIYDCGEMRTVVAAKAEEEEENVEIVFSKLTGMEFHNLAGLECFYPGKCTLEFPLLDTLRISKCDDMKIFSYGITNTPTLKNIEIGEHNSLPVLPTQGINDIIHAFFTIEVCIISFQNTLNSISQFLAQLYYQNPLCV
uniref:Uncharacterized protein n=1 Tax=Cucumis sativus TaxID=3659 RepID=A0A0A0K5R3_CUCSA